MGDREQGAGRLAELAGRTSAFFVLLGICFLVLGGLAQLIDLPFGIWFSEAGLLFLPVVLYLRANNLAPLRHLGLDRRLTGVAVLLIVLAAGANYVLAAGGMGILDQVLPKSWHLVNVEKILTQVHGWRLGVVLVAVVILAPICEETAFRGLLQQPLVARLGPAWGIGITAVVFSAFHGDPIGFLPRVELGVLFGWLYLRTGSLWASIAAHAVNNGAAAVLFLVAGGSAASAAGPSGGLRTLVVILAVGAAFTAPLVIALDRYLPEARVRPLYRLDPDAPVRLSRDRPETVGLAILVLMTLGVLALAVGGVLLKLHHP